MGWLDCHLWEFTANERKYAMLLPDDPDWNERIKDAARTKLSALLSSGVREIGYVYDMGDNWQHRVFVEKLKAAEPGVPYPQFLGGERRCPPEDCGGLPGYYEFLDNIANKQNKKRKNFERTHTNARTGRALLGPTGSARFSYRWQRLGFKPPPGWKPGKSAPSPDLPP